VIPFKTKSFSKPVVKSTENKISRCKMRDGIYNEVLREIYDKKFSNL
jgi:hypothetical protein